MSARARAIALLSALTFASTNTCGSATTAHVANASATAPVFASQRDCAFVHIFNDYRPSANQTTSQLEFKLVFESWLHAREVAFKHGIPVDLLAVLLRGDQLSVDPRHLAKVVTVNNVFVSPNGGVRLPLPGEILDAGLNATTRDVVVFANRDIGMYPDFFLTACRDLQRPGILAVERTRVLLEIDAAMQDFNATLYGRGRAHSGADAFVFPRHVLPECFRRDRKLVMGLPPWGVVLRHILTVNIQRIHCGASGGYLYTRGQPKVSAEGERYTFHLQTRARNPWFRALKVGNPELVVYLSYASQVSPRVAIALPGSRENQMDCVHDADGNKRTSMVFPLCRRCRLPCSGYWKHCATADCDETYFCNLTSTLPHCIAEPARDLAAQGEWAEDPEDVQEELEEPE